MPKFKYKSREDARAQSPARDESYSERERNNIYPEKKIGEGGVFPAHCITSNIHLRPLRVLPEDPEGTSGIYCGEHIAPTLFTPYIMHLALAQAAAPAAGSASTVYLSTSTSCHGVSAVSFAHSSLAR